MRPLRAALVGCEKSWLNHSVISTGREKTEMKKCHSLWLFKKQAYTKSIHRPLLLWAAELPRGGWMGPGPPHVKSRSYCSMETERERERVCYTLRWPTIHPLLSTSFSQSFQTQAEGVGCLDTAGGQAMGSDRYFSCRIINYLNLLLGNPARMAWL